MYLIDNEQYTETQIRERYKTTHSLHKPLNQNDLDAIGAVVILPTPKPEVAWNEKAVVDGVMVVDGNTVQKWKVVPMFSEYTNDAGVVVTVAEQEAEYQANLMQEKAKEAERVVQAHINSVVKGLGYDDENSIAKYLVDGSAFYDECRQLSLWISSIWVYAHQIQADVLAGTRAMPTIEELIAELPVYGE